jgi:putative ABC transport system permease protein
MHIPLTGGRMFSDADGPQSQRVALVNEAFAARFFPGRTALGKRVTFGDPAAPGTTWLTIVGVVANTRRAGFDRPPWAELYYPHRQQPDRRMAVVLRTSGDPAALARSAQAELWAIDRDQPVTSVRTLNQILERTEANRRFAATLLGLFAAVALSLAAIGVYGVMAYATAQRTHEIGVRMALGAGTGDVMRMVLRDGAIVAGAGVVIGLAGAAALTTIMAQLLFGVTPRDPVTFATAAALLLGVSLIASYVPARRATRVAPGTALRNH